MPRITISEQDLDPKNTDRLRRKLNDLYDSVYDVLGQLEKAKTAIANAQGGNLSDVERSILRALTIGSTETTAPQQTAVVPTVVALPPIPSSTPGQLVRFGGVIYIFDGSAWVTISAAATAHNLLSATHSDTLAAAPVLGDLIVGNATPKWARLGGNVAAVNKFLTQLGGGAVSAVPVWFDLFGTLNAWTQLQQFNAGIQVNVGQSASLYGAVDIGLVTKAAAYTIVDTDGPFLYITGGLPFTVKLPAAPTAGRIRIIKDDSGAAGASNLTVDGNGKNIDGAATKVINTNYGALRLIYNGTQWDTW